MMRLCSGWRLSRTSVSQAVQTISVNRTQDIVLTTYSHNMSVDPDNDASTPTLSIRIPMPGPHTSKLLHLPSPYDIFHNAIRSRSRSPSNASSRPPTPAASTVSTPIPSAPSTPHLSPVTTLESTDVASSYHHVLALPALSASLSPRAILALSLTSKFSRTRLCTAEVFIGHLSAHGWDTAALGRRTKAMTKEKARGRQWLHLARSAVQKETIPERYRALPQERLVKEKNKLGVNTSELTFTKHEKGLIDGLLKTLVDIATEHDEHNFNTLARLISQCTRPSLGLIAFLSDIPSYNWKSCARKAFILAAFINQQAHPEQFDDALDHFASSIDFWREGPQKGAKSLSLNNTRSALLYTKGLTAFLHSGPKSALSSHDYDHPVPGEVEAFPGLQKAIARFAELHQSEAAAETRKLHLEGTYWKSQAEHCPRSPMHFSVIAPPSSPKMLFSLPSSLSKTSELKFEATITDKAHTPWVMQGTLDRSTGRGRMVGSSGVVAYEVWVVPWGMVGHKVRLGKGGNGEGESLGDFVLVWGEGEREEVVVVLTEEPEETA